MDLKFGNNSSCRDFGLDNILNHATFLLHYNARALHKYNNAGRSETDWTRAPGPGAADIEFRTQQAARCEGRRKDPYRGI